MKVGCIASCAISAYHHRSLNTSTLSGDVNYRSLNTSTFSGDVNYRSLNTSKIGDSIDDSSLKYFLSIQ
jgi:DUF4097 and DUF4098 domain-containing protein YvlB